MNNYYIFTEIVGCGKIGKIAIDSFHRYHDIPIYIYGAKEDFVHIKENKNNNFIEVNEKILKKFNLGHWGTAHIWEDVIKNSKQDILIHFDSDVIFRENTVNDLIQKSNKGFDLVGSRRNYYSNKNNRDDVRFINDLCQTSLILFNKKKISKKYLEKYSFISSIKSLTDTTIKKIFKNILWTIRQISAKNIFVSQLCKMIHGTYSPFNFPHIDFFDPIMIDMLNNGAKIYYLNPEDTGTADFYGTSYSIVEKLDFGKKLIHFSGVGSGLNFINNPQVKSVSESYKKHCVNTYKIFCRIFYNEYIDDDILSKENQDILNIKHWY